MTRPRKPKPWAWDKIVFPAYLDSRNGQISDVLQEIERRIERLTILKKRRKKR